MAKIIALRDMPDVPVVLTTMDSSKEREIIVGYHGKIYKFKDCQDGLYYNDTAVDNPISSTTDKSNAPIIPYFFLRTVEDNISYFISNEIE